MTKSIINIISEYLGFDSDTTIKISKNAQTSYRRYLISKKKGGYRTIFHPSKQTKALQYAFIETILNKLDVHECAAAYIRGRLSPLLVNATKHSSLSFSIRLDFADFFPSISPKDLIRVIKMKEEYKDINNKDEQFLTDSLFIRIPGGKQGLAIGAPSSPIISNAVMYLIDKKITKLALSISPESVYTRYADDIVFSTNNKGGCSEFFDGVKDILAKSSSPKLTLNSAKTFFASRGTRRVVTGLYICPDGQVSLGRKNKRYIKKLLFGS